MLAARSSNGSTFSMHFLTIVIVFHVLGLDVSASSDYSTDERGAVEVGN